MGAAYLGGSGPVSHIRLPSRCQLGLQSFVGLLRAGGFPFKVAYL